MTKPNPADRVAYMAGQGDFRAARVRCTNACIEYNSTPENAPTTERAAKWLNIVDPDHTSKIDATQAVAIADAFTTVVVPRPTFPYVKMPFYVDYGLRVYISPTTFINRNCFIMDTPVADIRIGERCQIGPNVSIIGVGHSTKFEERNELETGVAGSWGAKVVIGDGVWIGANSTILPGVTVGSYTTIGAGSVVTKDLPSRCVAVGNPVKILYMIDEDRPPAKYAQTAMTLEEALMINREPESPGA
ncbi:trimeric LpxA-like protein [Coniella lustricola]|uniref:Trimeric LpxA-like protein n=1 Tax=Coniella lustricola TaxID=2025994 RepID=A0A2T3A1R6_9PEZI|nr:trimeric LpxA-like protein [Coniella lustricola]